MIEVQDGQLYLVRPLSPKGYSELIYKDASISIRRTSTEHNFQLVVTRVFEEGEQELLEEDEAEGLDAPQNSDSSSMPSPSTPIRPRTNCSTKSTATSEPR